MPSTHGTFTPPHRLDDEGGPTEELYIKGYIIAQDNRTYTVSPMRVAM